MLQNRLILLLSTFATVATSAAIKFYIDLQNLTTILDKSNTEIAYLIASNKALQESLNIKNSFASTNAKVEYVNQNVSGLYSLMSNNTALIINAIFIIGVLIGLSYLYHPNASEVEKIVTESNSAVIEISSQLNKEELSTVTNKFLDYNESMFATAKEYNFHNKTEIIKAINECHNIFLNTINNLFKDLKESNNLNNLNSLNESSPVTNAIETLSSQVVDASQSANIPEVTITQVVDMTALIAELGTNTPPV